MTLLIVITWLSVLFILLVMLFYLWYDRYQRKLHEHRRIEISELAMIFQTLRDIVSEQKTLAKEFNKQVEEKLSLVRDFVSESQNRMNKISLELQEQSKKVKELQKQLDGVIHQSQAFIENSSSNIQKDETIPIPKPKSIHNEFPFTAEIDKTEHNHENRPTLEKIKNDEKNGDLKNENDAVSSSISSIDTSKQDDELDKKDTDSLEHEKDEIKNEYRSLLGNSDKGLITNYKQISSNIVPDKTSELTPIQKIVLEYHNAGMTTSEIARELGIGKGEVWLILKLAISKTEKE